MDTIWKPIAAYPMYEISTDGQIRSYINGLRYRKLAKNNQGYPLVTFYKDGVTKTFLVHRILLETFVGPCPPGCESRHLDGDRGNCTLENLAWGTKKENYQDKVRHGTACHRYPDELARKIRKSFKTIPEISEEFGVPEESVSLILRRKTHQWLPEEPDDRPKGYKAYRHKPGVYEPTNVAGENGRQRMKKDREWMARYEARLKRRRRKTSP